MPFTADLNKLENAKREALQQKEHWNRRWRMASGEVQTLTMRLSGMPTSNSQYRQLHAERADAIERREKYARTEYHYGRAVHKIEDRIKEVLRQGKSAKALSPRDRRTLEATLKQVERDYRDAKEQYTRFEIGMKQQKEKMDKAMTVINKIEKTLEREL